MKKIMFIGSIGSGKTTLCQSILGENLSYHKTQSVDFYPEMIDTPGEFVQHRHYYNALQTISAEVDVIGLVSDVMEEEMTFSPNFAHNFMKTCIGIITKIDLCENPKKIEEAEARLYMAGVEKIFKVSAVGGAGLTDLADYLQRR